MSSFRGIRIEGDWANAEKERLPGILAAIPKRFLEDNQCIKAIIRRPVLENAPTGAPGHSKYDPGTGSIVVYDKGVYHGEEIDEEQFPRSIYHELAHAILANDKTLLARWVFETAGDGYVDEYARTSAEEDFADTFSELLIHPRETSKAVPQKARFLAGLLR